MQILTTQDRILTLPGGSFQIVSKAAGVAAAFAPSDIAGLKLWLKADAITGLVDGDPIATWTDQSGSGNNAVQATGTKQPLYKTAIKNGLPIVRFDGTDDILQTPVLFSSGNVTGFVVAQNRTNVGTYRPLLAALPLRGLTWLNNHMMLNIDASINSTSAFSTMVFYTFSFIYVASGVSTLGQNGSLVTGNAGTTPITTAWDIGGASAYNWFRTWDVGEVIIYDSAVSDANRISVENYLNTKWAVY
mgnify:FL=1